MAKSVPCLLVRQPYASLIAFGRKRWEFRSYNARKRGKILIAASRGRPVRTGDKTLNKAAKSFPRGVLLAYAELVKSDLVTDTDIKKISKDAAKTKIGDLEFLTADSPIGEPLEDILTLPRGWSGYAWHLENVTPLSEPIPLRKSCSPWIKVMDK